MIDLTQLRDDQSDDIEAARRAARATGTRPWLVGGAVRDLLLHLPVGDIDITVEGDAGRFASALATELGGELAHHERFLTYRIDRPGRAALDVVTARHEWYERPGDLPHVEPGTIEQDLLRRDFAANALGFDLVRNTLADPADGWSDIRQRSLRILHEESFYDDPTRIFRGVRLAHRLGFEFEASTDAAIDAAIRKEYLANVSPERLWREFDLALDEECASLALATLANRGALLRLSGAEPLSEDEALALRSSIERGRRFGLQLRPLTLAALGASHDHLGHSGSTLAEIRLVVQIRTDSAIVATRLARNRALDEGIATIPPEVVAHAAALDPSVASIVESWLRHREAKVAVDLTGLEIATWQRPLIGKAIRATRLALASGAITEEAASSFARRTILEYLRDDIVE